MTTAACPRSRGWWSKPGLADPAPLIHTVDANPLISHFCRLGAVLTTVDAINAPRQLAEQWEARKQVALADRLLRLKGVVSVDGENEPLLLHGVTPPVPPAAARAGDRLAGGAVDLVLIVRGARSFDVAALRAGFAGCLAAGGPGAQ